MTSIIVTHENNEMEEYDFDVEIRNITIGRRSTNDVCVPHLSVSGVHCKITIDDEGSMIEDQNSTNGTYINGRLISRQLLNDGDDIIIGKARLTFLQPQSTASRADTGSTVIESGSSATADHNGGLDSDNMAQANEVAAGQSPGVPEYSDVSPEDKELSLAEKAALNLRPAAGAVAGAGAVATAAVANNRVASATDEVVEGASEFAGDYYEPDDSEIKAMISDGPADDVLDSSFQEESYSSAQSSPADSLQQANAEGSSAVAAETDSMAAISDQDNELGYVLDNPASQDSTGAVIEIKNGAKSGQVLPIDKPVTTLGRPGIQIAAIMKKPEGYFLMHIESENTADRPRLNDSMIGDDPVMLNSGDSLNVAGIDVQFMLS